jgi:gliding motility-associated lipoprotein GldH
MKFRTVSILVSFAMAIAFSACNSNRLYEQNTKIANGSWAAHNNIPFTIVIDDTASLYDFYVNIRNDVNYPYSNLYLFLKTTFPDKSVARDTIECLLASYDGRWLGSGMGSVRYSKFLFQKSVRLRKAGTYTFEFEQAMRIDPLKGIRDLGIRIDKHQPSSR